MSERQETSVMASIQDILRDAQLREEQEKVAAQKRVDDEEKARLDALKRQQDEEEARLKAAEDDRQRRAFEDQRRQAELQALQEATIQRQKMEAEAQARLAELNARQHHERELAALHQDKSKKRLKTIAIVVGSLLVVGAIGGGITLSKQSEKMEQAEQRARLLENEKEQAEQERSRLNEQLAKATDQAEAERLRRQLAAKDLEIKSINEKRAASPAPRGGYAPPPRAGGGSNPAPAKPCSCTPGDPLCSCL